MENSKSEACLYGEHKSDYTWWEYDAQGIPLCKVCEHCRAQKLAGYRREILRGYTQADVDEPVEDEY